jgi:hypothetical protein
MCHEEVPQDLPTHQILSVDTKTPTGFLQVGAHYQYVRWQEFSVISAGQDSNVAVI